jgi:hypothetical protein
MSVSNHETERIEIPQYLRSLSDAPDAALSIALGDTQLADLDDADPAIDCMVRVEHLEATLGDIASAAIVLREYAQAPGGISKRDVFNAAQNILSLANAVRPSAANGGDQS